MLSVSKEKYQSDILNIDLEIYQDDESVYWFHGATLCDIFELPNPSQMIQRHVDDDWRKKFPAVRGKDSWYVMEPGFYQLLHVSKHPAAKRFQRWVYSEVLPKLRADGGYIMPNATSEQIRALTGKFNYLNEKHRREIYPLFNKVAGG
jgi:prophage antirepressor-like protein